MKTPRFHCKQKAESRKQKVESKKYISILLLLVAYCLSLIAYRFQHCSNKLNDRTGCAVSFIFANPDSGIDDFLYVPLIEIAYCHSLALSFRTCLSADRCNEKSPNEISRFARYDRTLEMT